MEQIKSIFKFNCMPTFISSQLPPLIFRAIKPYCSLCKSPKLNRRYVYRCSKCEYRYCILCYKEHHYANKFGSAYNIRCTTTMLEINHVDIRNSTASDFKRFGKHFRSINIHCRHYLTTKHIQHAVYFKSLSMPVM